MVNSIKSNFNPTKKEVLALIPARGGSKSIPRKNLKLLGGHPLIAYSIEAGLKAQKINRVIVSTDDKEIANISVKYGADVPFIRPSEIAKDDTPDFPVFEHVLNYLSSVENYKPDIIVQLRPTSPFRPQGFVDQAISILINNLDADSLRAVIPSGQNPYKMWKMSDGYMKPLMNYQHPEPYNQPRQKLPETYWQTGHIDVIRSRTIHQKKSLSGEYILPILVDPLYGIDIDTALQWSFAEWILKQGLLNIVTPAHPLMNILKYIKLVILDFDGVFTDNRVFVNINGEESVVCNRSDGLGLAELQKIGVNVNVISGESNPIVDARCQKLNIPCHYGIKDKITVFQNIISSYGLSKEQVIYIGNDINDLDCMKMAKLGIAVADAHPDILKSADWILNRRGGEGAIREACDLIIMSQKKGGSH